VNVQHFDYCACAGTFPHDIVRAINAAVAVLQDKPAPAPFSIKDKKEAIFFLAHFLGDVHQPLHVGAVYLNPKGRLLNPDGKGGLNKASETHGGNSILDGKTNMLARERWPRTSSCLRAPSSVTRPERPAASMRACSSPRSGPSPITWHSNGIDRLASIWQASIKWRKPLISSSRPTARISPGWRPSGWKAKSAGRTPQWTMRKCSRAAGETLPAR